MIRVIPVTTPQQLSEAHGIRRKVFVDEQNCPPELEYEFEEESRHFLALYNGIPAGTARWRETTGGYKLERFAVLKEMRNKRVGDALLSAILADVPGDGKKIYLHAQLTAEKFYSRNGFAPFGQQFTEAGIEHVKMQFTKR